MLCQLLQQLEVSFFLFLSFSPNLDLNNLFKTLIKRTKVELVTVAQHKLLIIKSNGNCFRVIHMALWSCVWKINIRNLHICTYLLMRKQVQKLGQFFSSSLCKVYLTLVLLLAPSAISLFVKQVCIINEGSRHIDAFMCFLRVYVVFARSQTNLRTPMGASLLCLLLVEG